ncbi:phosphoribosylformylglycinamidine synthase [Prochlorococcus marinus str. MIT 9515]|uniref:Phosphoribosylformylglycinamidine synthase subunit PurQ n=1 Tax=Prochlorococcus marinus (strain MIT 9515) TaxID=167542 RepID=A2BW50_PROM5|nr:phosphoribosylformylglycinamidine synthase subunit PurQ [Prochlorococcus marinus]ABM72011.1 phosphoribosylformylglycinamidine synthase [Prochlorococcus marinus str. MIT 9515]
MACFTVGIVVFPGSNCDRDVAWALEACLDIKTKFLWHESSDLNEIDAIVLPGGFSYGDYLRCGAIARFSPLINSLNDFVKSGRRVLGICNGFQILTESGFLPGALVANKNLNFICDDADLNVITSKGGWFKNSDETQKIKLPIAHGEGRYHCDQNTLKKLIDNDLIALRYKNNPNGSTFDIAGITNEKGNVLGLMPHPERACDEVIGGTDGLYTLKSLMI